MLEVTGLTKTYGGVLAVKDLSFSARRGQVIGFLGPNGSGKSTSIRVLTGLLRATRGRVCWNGVDIQSQLLDYQARLGYVPEEPHLYQYLTASFGRSPSEAKSSSTARTYSTSSRSRSPSRAAACGVARAGLQAAGHRGKRGARRP